MSSIYASPSPFVSQCFENSRWLKSVRGPKMFFICACRPSTSPPCLSLAPVRTCLPLACPWKVLFLASRLCVNHAMAQERETTNVIERPREAGRGTFLFLLKKGKHSEEMNDVDGVQSNTLTHSHNQSHGSDVTCSHPWNTRSTYDLKVKPVQWELCSDFYFIFFNIKIRVFFKSIFFQRIIRSC